MPFDVASGHQPELGDYLRVLRRRKRPLLLVMAAVVGLALAASFLQTPVYAATAEVLLQRSNTETLFDPNTGQPNDPQREVQTQIRVVSSEPVVKAVREKLGYSANISASSAGQTDVLRLRAENTAPRKAAAIANAYADAYIEVRRSQAVDDVLNAVKQMQNTISDLQRQIDAAPPGPSKDSLVELQSAFRTKQSELQVTASLQSGGARPVRSAAVPSSPIRPKPVRDFVLALVLGGLLGIGVAFVLEYLDDSVRSKEQLERVAPSVPILATIPAVAEWKAKDEPVVVSLVSPTSPAAEAYRTMRTSIQFMGLDRPVRSLLVTSATSNEGKTTTIANLGVALARAGTRVVIVCCDLRRPRVHEFFGLSNQVGFTSVLLGTVTLEDALQPVAGVERLSILASGPLPPNPSELLQSHRTAEVLNRLRATGVFVLLDSPPILPVTDGLVLSRLADGVVAVCSAEGTSRKDLARALELLRQVDAPVIGSVLNRAPHGAGYYRTYGYQEYRAADPQGSGSSSSGNGHNGNGLRDRAKRARRSKST